MACITQSLWASPGRFAIPRAMESIEVGLGVRGGEGQAEWGTRRLQGVFWLEYV